MVSFCSIVEWGSCNIHSVDIGWLGFLLQYGHIVHVDLKMPPRPPGYAFVEVSIDLPLAISSSLEVFFWFEYFVTVWRSSWCWRCHSGAWWLWFWWASPAGWFCSIFLIFWILMPYRYPLPLVYLWSIQQVELAHGGRGHPSSTDRYSNHSGSRGPRGGVSKRSEYRGGFAWIMQYKNHLYMVANLSHFVSFFSCSHWTAPVCFMARS